MKKLTENSMFAEAAAVLSETEKRVMEEIDPVDWTLAESYMEMAMNDFISSVALLLSPLLPEGPPEELPGTGPPELPSPPPREPWFCP